MRRIGTLASILVLTACATAAPSVEPGAEPRGTQTEPGQPWAIRTREHVDLWLHGYAMLQEDTTLVPYFRRGYRAQMQTLKTRANVQTQLDANASQLRQRLAANSQLINGQFLPLYFISAEQLFQAAEFFIRVQGEPRAAGSQEAAEVVAIFASYFPSGGDREWLRLFVQSLRDEHNRFYRAYWAQQQRERAPVVSAVTNIWQGTYRPRFERFLNNTALAGGEIILSLPLDGEGRSLTVGKRQNAVAVTFPDTPGTAVEAIYVIAHEVVSSIANTAVRDHLTPAEVRSGLGERLGSAALVRGGALLLQRVAPELVDGYARYYLRAINRTPGANPTTSLTAAFPLPERVASALNQQLEIILGGI